MELKTLPIDITSIKTNLDASIRNNKITVELFKEEFGPLFRGELDNEDTNIAIANWLRVADGHRGSVDLIDEDGTLRLTVPPIYGTYESLNEDKTLPFTSMLREQKLEENRMGLIGERVAKEILEEVGDLTLAPVDLTGINKVLYEEKDKEGYVVLNDDDDELIFD